MHAAAFFRLRFADARNPPRHQPFWERVGGGDARDRIIGGFRRAQAVALAVKLTQRAVHDAFRHLLREFDGCVIFSGKVDRFVNRGGGGNAV